MTAKHLCASNADIECLWIIVKHPHLPLMLIGSIYRQPGGKIEVLNSNVDNTTKYPSKLKNINKEIDIIGASMLTF